MFKVTLKLNPSGEWIDGPVVILETATELNEFALRHDFFKVETATQDDITLYGRRVPSAFRELLK